MLLPSTLQMILAAAGTPVTNSDESDNFDPVLAAMLARYENLLSDITNNIISNHITPIQNKERLFKAMSAYDGAYLMSLPLSYTGISEVCQYLVNKCNVFKINPPQIWSDYANGKFDWQDDLDALAKVTN
jgi:hypothetical protein